MKWFKVTNLDFQVLYSIPKMDSTLGQMFSSRSIEQSLDSLGKPVGDPFRDYLLKTIFKHLLNERP